MGENRTWAGMRKKVFRLSFSYWGDHTYVQCLLVVVAVAAAVAVAVAMVEVVVVAAAAVAVVV